MHSRIGNGGPFHSLQNWERRAVSRGSDLGTEGGFVGGVAASDCCQMGEFVAEDSQHGGVQ